MIWRRQTSLLFAALLLAACASSPPAKPEIPDSVSPGWKLVSLNRVLLHPVSPDDAAPDCWKADYRGTGSAEVSICWYQATAGAFDALQRTPAEAQTVKFQEGHYFILVSWNDVPKANLTALVRALEKALQPAQK